MFYRCAYTLDAQLPSPRKSVSEVWSYVELEKLLGHFDHLSHNFYRGEKNEIRP